MAGNKKKDKIWGQIAKTVNIAMAAEALGNIQQKQVDYILKAIIDQAFPEGPVEKPSQETRVVKDNAIPSPLIPKPIQPKTSNPLQTKPDSKTLNKLMLQMSLNGNKPDNKLIIWLHQTLPYKNKHIFLLQKKPNAALQSHITVRKIVYIKIGIALILTNGLMLL